MFPRQNRLAESQRVIAVVRHGSSLQGRHWRIVALRPREVGSFSAQPGRCTVVVSKKIAKMAHTRNRIKRRVREAMAASGIPTDSWIVVFPRPSANEAPFLELKEDAVAWRHQWTKA